jgi:thiamine transport system substrate-binding protein
MFIRECHEMKRIFQLLSLSALLMLSVVVSAQDQVVTLVTYDSFSMSEDAVAQFESESGYRLEIVRLTDAGAMVNQAILTQSNPLGDVLYGIDTTFLSRGLNAGLFDVYQAAGLETISEALRLPDDIDTVTPVAFGDVCLNYDAVWFGANDVAVPDSLIALADPIYEGLLVVENPASSSPGLAFLLATIAEFGEIDDYTWLNYWADLVANDVLVVEGWTEAYYGEFSGASEDGERPLVVSYASSPPAEVYFADPQPEIAPTGAVVADGTCFRQVEYAGVLSGTDNPEGAQALVDYFLSETFQSELPLQMFVFPVVEDTLLPDVFAEFAALPELPAQVDAELIETNREAWIQAWTQAVLR